jgi:aldose 1-epimerase
VNVPSGCQVRLSHRPAGAGGSAQELVVVEVGGGIRSYNVGDRPVLDGYEADEMCSGGRGQLLAPWPNRLRDGQFEWQGHQYQTPLTQPDEHNAIHGLVRWSAWDVAESGPDHARLEHRLHPQPGWPWTLDFSVAYLLNDSGLEVRMAVVNAAPAKLGDCPFGVGWHPYIAAFGGLVDDILLTVPAEEGYKSDDRGLPAGRFSVDGTEVDFRTSRRIGDQRLDQAFTGLTRDDRGRATVEVRRAGSGPQASVKLWVDSAFTHLMVFSGDTLAPERRRQALAVEPMTCPPDMLRSGEGRIVLAPGARFEATWGLEPAGLG